MSESRVIYGFHAVTSHLRSAPDGVRASNYGFDVTPARLVTGLVTERGIVPATRDGLKAAFPERAGGG